MNGFSLLLAALTMGVDYGWQPTTDGHLEYIIQIEPVTLIAMREGQEVVSQIDPQMRNVRRFRIHVGTEMVPRRGNPPAQMPATGITAAMLPNAPGVQFGWQPVSRDQLEFIVQIVAERMTTLRTGDDIVGDMPIDLPNVARVRVITGNATLPRQGFQSPTAQPLALGQPPSNTNLPSMMLAPPRAADPTLNYGSAATSQPNLNSSSWAAPNQAGNSWSTGANAAIPNRDQGLLMQDPQRGAPRYQDPQTNTQDWRSNWGTNASTASAADPRFTSFPQAPPTQSLQDPNRYRDGGYAGYPAAGTPTPYNAAQAQPRWDGASTTGTNWNANWNQASARPNPNPNTAAPTQPGAGQPYASGYGGVEGSQGNSWNTPAPSTAGWAQPRATGREGELARTGAPGMPYSEFGLSGRDPNLKYPLNQAELAKDRPWGALTVAVFLLFASIGGNLYLGWIAARIYRLYLDLADDLEDKERHDATAEAAGGEDHWKERRKRRRAILGV